MALPPTRPGQSIADRLTRRLSLRRSVGPSPSFYARFGLDGPGTGVGGEGGADGGLFSFLSAADYYAELGQRRSGRSRLLHRLDAQRRPRHRASRLRSLASPEPVSVRLAHSSESLAIDLVNLLAAESPAEPSPDAASVARPALTERALARDGVRGSSRVARELLALLQDVGGAQRERLRAIADEVAELPESRQLAAVQRAVRGLRGTARTLASLAADGVAARATGGVARRSARSERAPVDVAVARGGANPEQGLRRVLARSPSVALADQPAPVARAVARPRPVAPSAPVIFAEPPIAAVAQSARTQRAATRAGPDARDRVGTARRPVLRQVETVEVLPGVRVSAADARALSARPTAQLAARAGRQEPSPTARGVDAAVGGGRPSTGMVARAGRRAEAGTSDLGWSPIGSSAMGWLRDLPAAEALPTREDQNASVGRSGARSRGAAAELVTASRPQWWQDAADPVFASAGAPSVEAAEPFGAALPAVWEGRLASEAPSRRRGSVARPMRAAQADGAVTRRSRSSERTPSVGISQTERLARRTVSAAAPSAPAAAPSAPAAAPSAPTVAPSAPAAARSASTAVLSASARAASRGAPTVGRIAAPVVGRSSLHPAPSARWNAATSEVLEDATPAGPARSWRAAERADARLASPALPSAARAFDPVWTEGVAAAQPADAVELPSADGRARRTEAASPSRPPGRATQTARGPGVSPAGRAAARRAERADALRRPAVAAAVPVGAAVRAMARADAPARVDAAGQALLAPPPLAQVAWAARASAAEERTLPGLAPRDVSERLSRGSAERAGARNSAIARVAERGAPRSDAGMAQGRGDAAPGARGQGQPRGVAAIAAALADGGVWARPELPAEIASVTGSMALREGASPAAVVRRRPGSRVRPVWDADGQGRVSARPRPVSRGVSVEGAAAAVDAEPASAVGASVRAWLRGVAESQEALAERPVRATARSLRAAAEPDGRGRVADRGVVRQLEALPVDALLGAQPERPTWADVAEEGNAEVMPGGRGGARSVRRSAARPTRAAAARATGVRGVQPAVQRAVASAASREGIAPRRLSVTRGDRAGTERPRAATAPVSFSFAEGGVAPDAVAAQLGDAVAWMEQRAARAAVRAPGARAAQRADAPERVAPARMSVARAAARTEGRPSRQTLPSVTAGLDPALPGAFELPIQQGGPVSAAAQQRRAVQSRRPLTRQLPVSEAPQAPEAPARATRGRAAGAVADAAVARSARGGQRPVAGAAEPTWATPAIGADASPVGAPAIDGPAWSARGDGPGVRRSGQRPARRSAMLSALARSERPEDVVKVILEGSQSDALVRELPAPAARLVERILRLGEAADAAGATPSVLSPTAVSPRSARGRPEMETLSSDGGSFGRRTRSRASAGAQSANGVGASNVMKLANKLMKLIHLAESERKLAEAQAQVRMAADSLEARSEAGHGNGAGPSEGIGDAHKNMEALQKEVLEVVLRELELNAQRRGEEDPDGLGIWF